MVAPSDTASNFVTLSNLFASNYQLFIPTLLIRGPANLQEYCLCMVYLAATLLVTKVINIASIIRDKMASQFSPNFNSCITAFDRAVSYLATFKVITWTPLPALNSCKLQAQCVWPVYITLASFVFSRPL